MSMSGLRHYLSEIRSYPLLSRDEERAVGMKLTGHMNEATRRMVVSNLRFVAKIAVEYKDRGIPVEDLIGEGNIGLIEAAIRFDAARGVRFTTYAAWWIKKAIRSALVNGASSIRIPVHRLRKEASGASGDGLLPSRDPRFRTQSLGDPVGPRPGRCAGDLLADAGRPDPEEEALRRDRLRLLIRIWPMLSARERAVVAGRFGLAGERALTLREMGALLGLTRERVRQIEKEAIAKLRKEVRTLLRPCTDPPRIPRSRCRAA